MNSHVSTAFSNQTTREPCPSIIEQKDWDGAGLVTRADIVKELYNSLFGSGENPFIDCGMNADGTYKSIVYMYLGYTGIQKYGITNGNMEEPVIDEALINETVDFSVSSSEKLDHFPNEIFSYDWIGDVYDENGKVVDPVVTFDEDIVKTNIKVYGVLGVRYETLRYAFSITVPPREDNSFDSVIWAIKDCGVELHELSPPNGAEWDSENDSDCGYGGSSTINDDDDRPPPKAGPKDVTINIDYCSQTVI